MPYVSDAALEDVTEYHLFDYLVCRQNMLPVRSGRYRTRTHIYLCWVETSPAIDELAAPRTKKKIHADYPDVR